MKQQETLDIRNTLEYLAQECQDRNAQLQKFTHAGVDRCFSMYLERDSPFCKYQKSHITIEQKDDKGMPIASTYFQCTYRDNGNGNGR
jgi:hypothetical protein